MEDQNSLTKLIENTGFFRENARDTLTKLEPLYPCLKVIPPISATIKILTEITNLSNTLLEAKIKDFLFELESIEKQEQEEFVKEMEENPKKAEKVGEIILFSLDKISDTDKSKFLAKIFIAYVRGKIDFSDFRRITEAVNTAFVDDLKTLNNKVTNPDRIPPRSQEIYLRYLSSSGLTQILAGELIDDAGQIYYEVTELGLKFLKAYQYANSLAKVK